MRMGKYLEILIVLKYGLIHYEKQCVNKILLKVSLLQQLSTFVIVNVCSKKEEEKEALPGHSGSGK